MRLRRQAAIRLAADLIGRGLSFGLAYLAQRVLGPADYGELTYALAVGFVLATLIDLGLQITVTREIAGGPTRADGIRFANAGLTLKLLLSLPAALVLIAISRSRSPAAQFGSLVVGLSLLLNSFVEYFGYTLRGWQRADLEAGWLLAMRAVTAIGGSAALAAGAGWAGLTLAYGGSAILLLAGCFVWLKARSDRYFAPRLSLDGRLQRRLLRAALPLGGAIVMSIAYTRTAVLMLDALTSSDQVGVYGVAQKLTEPLAMFPAALLAVVFPALTRDVAQRGYAATRSLRVRTLTTLLLTGGTLALGGLIGGPWLIDRLYGESYRAAGPVVQALALTLPLSFINYALSHILIARHKQRLNLIFNVIVFAVNIAACSLWIPTAGPLGAAASVILSEGVLLILCALTLLRRDGG